MSATAHSRNTPHLVHTLTSPDATAGFARALAPLLNVGDVITLAGPIGAGKTHLARAIILTRLAAVGLVEDVPSPTFTLVQTYESGPIEIWHADLYRLDASGDIAELGLDLAFETAICLVEWPDRLGPDTPAERLDVDLSPGPEDDQRRLRLTAFGARWAARWDEIAACLNG